MILCRCTRPCYVYGRWEYFNGFRQNLALVMSSYLSKDSFTEVLLWNSKVHYRIYKSSPPVPILSQINLDNAPHPTSWESILILSSHPHLGFPCGLLPSGFPTKTLHAPPPHMCYMPHPSHSSQFDHQNNIWWGVQIIKLLNISFHPSTRNSCGNP